MSDPNTKDLGATGGGLAPQNAGQMALTVLTIAILVVVLIWMYVQAGYHKEGFTAANGLRLLPAAMGLLVVASVYWQYKDDWRALSLSNVYRAAVPM